MIALGHLRQRNGRNSIALWCAMKALIVTMQVSSELIPAFERQHRVGLAEEPPTALVDEAQVGVK